MTEWLFERGIGEMRAMLLDAGETVELHVERDGGLRVGDVFDARLVRQLGGGQAGARRRAIALGPDGQEVLLDPMPAEATEGAVLRLVIVRLAISEKSRFKLPRGRAAAANAVPARGPDLGQRIAASGLPVREVGAHMPDLLAQHGWYEHMEAAASGHVPFPGGSLDIGLTAGMTVIDVDGDLAPRALSLAAAQEAARTICRMGLSGSIGIDFPTLPDKADRMAVGEAFDAAMARPCERTAINGFGFMQVVLKRERPSLPEIIAADRRLAAALDLLRRAERTGGTGAILLTAHPAVLARLEQRPDWLEELRRRTGRMAILAADPQIAIDHGHVQPEGN